MRNPSPTSSEVASVVDRAPSDLFLKSDSPSVTDSSTPCAEPTAARERKRKDTEANLVILQRSSIIDFLGGLIFVAARGRAKMDHLTIHVPFDGRGYSDKGSANRIFLQLAG